MIVLTAGGLLVDRFGKVLLGLRSPSKIVAPNAWEIVGGYVQPGKSVEGALVREIFEELGVVPTCFRLLASLHKPSFYTCLHYVFAITAWTRGEPRNVSDEHSRIGWFTRAELYRLPNKIPLDFDELCDRAGIPDFAQRQ